LVQLPAWHDVPGQTFVQLPQCEGSFRSTQLELQQIEPGGQLEQGPASAAASLPASSAFATQSWLALQV